MALVLRTGRNEVDAGGFNAGMAKDISQLGDIVAHLVKRAGKKVPQVMGKDLGGHHSRRPTE